MAIVLNGSANTITPAAVVQPAGSLLQVVQATSTTQSEITSDTDFFSATITPSATSSNVVVNAILYIGGACNPNGGFQLKRASTAINVTATQQGGTTDAMWTMDDFGNADHNSNKATATAVPVLFYDTGISTTSATTYTFRTTSVTEFMFNRTTYGASNGYMTSILQLWEIAG